jgi:hypothetical protein
LASRVVRKAVKPWNARGWNANAWRGKLSPAQFARLKAVYAKGGPAAAEKFLAGKKIRLVPDVN